MTPKDWIRLEGVVGFLVCLAVYFYFGFSILAFLLFLFVPDVFMLGYFINNKVGAFVYNVGHVFIFPLISFLVAAATGSRLFLMIGLIWSAHIFVDRFAGYGLKYEEGFKFTHLNKLD